VNPLKLVLLLYQSVVLALRQIWSNKLRSLLTTIGIVIGVASVTAVIAALSGLQTRVLSEFESFGTSKLWVFSRRPDTGPLRNASFLQIVLRPEQFNSMLENAPAVKNFTRIVTSSFDVRFEDAVEKDVNVAGIESSWHKIENRYVTLGRPFVPLDDQRGSKVCLIDVKLQQRLRLPRDPVGTAITVGSERFVVVGIVEAGVTGNIIRDGISDSEMFVPFSTLYTMERSAFYVPFMYLMATAQSPQAAPDAQAEITAHLRNVRRLKPSDPNTFRVDFAQRFVDQFKQLAFVVTAVATGIVGVSLLVGGVGIMNIMLVSVSERTREIGLRKAVGAKPSAILLQFLVEAVVLCLIGGLVGLAFGYGMTEALKSVPGIGMDAAAVPTWAVVLSFGFSAVVGVVFGMFPAIKAARLDPIDALRHE
jgi:putative ABC transport system permease protein